MTRIKDLQNYYSVNVMPMDKDGNEANGECRSFFIHKSKFKKLAEYLDELFYEQGRESQ